MENNEIIRSKRKSLNTVLLFTGIIFVSFNLRPAITSVGPLIGFIRDDIGISNGLAGLLTTLPLLSFAILSFLAPKLGYRFGNEMMIFTGLLILLVGIIIRSIGFTPGLFAGTAFVGVGIAISNVLLPSIVKNRYPTKIGLLTGVYTTSMSTFAALGSGLSIPLAQGLNLGWRYSLLFWSILVFIALVMWVPQLRRRTTKSAYIEKIDLSKQTVWRSKLAWHVTLFMGLQSFLFYSMIAWLPEILSSNGLNISTAGWMISIMQLAGLPVAFLTPLFADRFRDQKGIVWIIGVLYLSGILGLVFGVSMFTIGLSIVLIGLGQGASISLSLTLLGLRAANSKQAAELSGMAQSIGYALAAIGPIFIGYILDITQSGIIPLIIFSMVVMIMIIAGQGAGKNQTVFQS